MYQTALHKDLANTTFDPAGLVAARLCHDLLNPIGAIGNVAELMALTSSPQAEELALLHDCVRAANGKLQFFRAAFVAPKNGPPIAIAELVALCNDMFPKPRLTVTIDRDQFLIPAVEHRLILLLLLCVQTSLPMGGHIVVGNSQVVAQGPKIAPQLQLWSVLQADPPAIDLLPAQVHFLLLAQALRAASRTISTEFGETSLIVVLD